MSVQMSPGVAALGTPEPTGQVSYGAALLRTGDLSRRTLNASTSGMVAFRAGSNMRCRPQGLAAGKQRCKGGWRSLAGRVRAGAMLSTQGRKVFQHPLASLGL